jgi:hypothetical protein
MPSSSENSRTSRWPRACIAVASIVSAWPAPITPLEIDSGPPGRRIASIRAPSARRFDTIAERPEGTQNLARVFLSSHTAKGDYYSRISSMPEALRGERIQIGPVAAPGDGQKRVRGGPDFRDGLEVERGSGRPSGVIPMATAIQKIVLSSSRDIPFNKLVLSQSSGREGRCLDRGLAASIARRGLIQSLSVIPWSMPRARSGRARSRPAAAAAAAGARAGAASPESLAPSPCVVTRDEVLAEEVSLVENIDRAPLHPLDQFRAFQDMRVKGRPRRSSSCQCRWSSSACAAPASPPSHEAMRRTA